MLELSALSLIGSPCPVSPHRRGGPGFVFRFSRFQYFYAAWTFTTHSSAILYFFNITDITDVTSLRRACPSNAMGSPHCNLMLLGTASEIVQQDERRRAQEVESALCECCGGHHDAKRRRKTAVPEESCARCRFWRTGHKVHERRHPCGQVRPQCEQHCTPTNGAKQPSPLRWPNPMVLYDQAKHGQQFFGGVYMCTQCLFDLDNVHEAHGKD